jgi:predicted HTH transcriptional regulator
MPLPPFPSDEELMTMKVFPYLEGKQYEFKQAFTRLIPLDTMSDDGILTTEYSNCMPINQSVLLTKTFERIEQTCCAFLNSDGGYIICGIRDKDREIVWLSIDDIEMDKILLRIDNIFHCKTIYTTDLEDIKPENIKTRILTKDGKYLIIISIEPSPGKKYRMHEYEWVRLNASNYANKREKFFRAKDVNGLIYYEQMKMAAKYNFAIEERDRKIKRLTRTLNLEMEESELLIAQKILAEKKAAEELLAKARHTCILRLNYGNILNFIKNIY